MTSLIVTIILLPIAVDFTTDGIWLLLMVMRDDDLLLLLNLYLYQRVRVIFVKVSGAECHVRMRGSGYPTVVKRLVFGLGDHNLRRMLNI